jgi:threonine/homoserine/homoserine lactone efflux protein
VSFFPQFLPRTGPVLPTVIALATIQVLLDTVWCAGIVLLADRARGWLGRGQIKRRIERTLGAVLVALGFELGLQTR